MEINNLNTFKTKKEKEWGLLNNCFIRPICIMCGNPVRFKSLKEGFNETCSKKCAALNPKRNEKIKNTSLKKYGSEHYTQSKQYKFFCKEQYKKLGYRPGGFNTPENKKAIKEKYGVDNVFQSDEIKKKIKSSMQKRYGVDSPQQNKIIRNKSKETQIKCYGQDGFNPTKTKQTLQKKYGVDNPLKSKKIRNKIKNILIKRYGVEYALQNPEIYEKCILNKIKNSYKFKEYISPTGKKYRVKGYEGNVIDYLIQAGINENDFTNLRIEIPTIEYYFDGKKRIYYPDIFIRSKNMLIEVKSTYSYMKEMDKNLAKQNSCKRAGYNHIIIIWDKKNDHIFEII
ncbi:MAG: hypothetical protein QXG00_07140 [Candidatus Woesearchaeota archaeon]